MFESAVRAIDRKIDDPSDPLLSFVLSSSSQYPFLAIRLAIFRRKKKGGGGVCSRSNKTEIRKIQDEGFNL